MNDTPPTNKHINSPPSGETPDQDGTKYITKEDEDENQEEKHEDEEENCDEDEEHDEDEDSDEEDEETDGGQEGSRERCYYREKDKYLNPFVCSVCSMSLTERIGVDLLGTTLIWKCSRSTTNTITDLLSFVCVSYDIYVLFCVYVCVCFVCEN